MPVAWTTVLGRIRRLLIEDTAAYFDDTYLKEWYDQGVAEQHRLVLHNLGMRPDIDPHEHDYIGKFISTQSFNTASGTFDYAMPSDHMLTLGIVVEFPNIDAVRARKVPWADDWYRRELPQFRPAWQPRYTFTPEGMLRLYLPSLGDPVPSAVVPVKHYYIRDVVKTTTNTDLDDPYNTGPVRYAVGMGNQEQRNDGSPWFAQAQSSALAILPPPPQQQGGAQ